MTPTTSIYIPRMSRFWTEERIREIMTDPKIGFIGFVSHVDFTPINKKPGFGEDIDKVVMSAFIHFSNLSDYEEDYYSNYLNEKFWSAIINGGSYKLQVSPSEYWICLKNKNPIQRTLMNIHQVVENGRHVENLVQEQAKKIEELERKLDGVHQVVYQLLGGLYCQHSQTDILQHHIRVLFCKEDENPMCNNSQWGIWPTTRQGDECERRIEALENALKENEDQDSQLLMRKYHRVEIDDDSTINSELIGEHIIEMEDYETPDYRWRHQK